MPDLTLRRITWEDGQPSLDPEDYSVRQGGRDVGRVYYTTSGACGSGYAWFISGTSRAGFAATLDDAKAAGKAAHAAMPPPWSDPMKEIVLVTLAVDAESG
jgi:hypothetical protein